MKNEQDRYYTISCKADLTYLLLALHLLPPSHHLSWNNFLSVFLKHIHRDFLLES